jgi:Rod binding domain-containing protein
MTNALSLSADMGRLAAQPLPPNLSVKADAAKNQKAAQDFEAMLLTPVLESLQKTFGGDPEEDQTVGASDYRHMSTMALAQALAARGGIGIGRIVLQHLQQPKVSGGGGTGD